MEKIMIKKHKEHRFGMKHQRDSKKYHHKNEKNIGDRNLADRNVNQVITCFASEHEIQKILSNQKIASDGLQLFKTICTCYISLKQKV